MNLYTKANMIVNKDTQLSNDIEKLNNIKEYLVNYDSSCNIFNLYQIDNLWGLYKRNCEMRQIYADYKNLEDFIDWIEIEFEWL